LPVVDPASHALRYSVPAEWIVIEKVEVNPKLDASLFRKQQIQTASNSH
jgi:hypothetical protein